MPVEWIATLKDFGFPVFLLVVSGYALFKGASWIGTNVIIPVRDSAISFLTDMKESQKQIAETLKKLETVRVDKDIEVLRDRSHDILASLTRIELKLDLPGRLKKEEG